MMVHFTLNGCPKELECRAGDNVQQLLFNLGMHSVRNSDDGFGFAGSDAILFNQTIHNASLLIAAQLDNATIVTAESLASWNQLSIVQQAMIDVGIVQSGYNDPAAALIITDLLNRITDPDREQIDDALSGLFSRDAGYQQFYTVVDLAKNRLIDPAHQITVAPIFRDDLTLIGKIHPKTDSAKMVQAKPCYVEDRIAHNACVIKMLRSPHAHAVIRQLNVTKAEALAGVIHVISGDTDHALFDKGAYASSGTCFSGNAAKKAAENLRQKILFHGPQILNEPKEDVSLAHPGIVCGKQGQISYAEIVHQAETGTGFGVLVATASYVTNDFAFPFGANFAEVAVNLRTGQIRLNKFYSLLDCGTPINPDLALGQIYGATLRAIGHSLTEEIQYDSQSNPLTPDLRSYGAPKIGDIPADFGAFLVPSDDPVGPFRAKSISEIGVNGAAPAITSAIHDACNIWLRDWPFTPEKILTALGKL